MWPQGPGVGPCTKPSISGLETGQLGPLGGACGRRVLLLESEGGQPFWCSDHSYWLALPALPPTLPAEFPRPSPAELPGVIHVWACLNVPFLGVVDGGGSGIRPAQDEHEAIERDSGSVLVVCQESTTGRSGHLFWATPSPPLPSPERPPEDGLWQRTAPPSAVNPRTRPGPRGQPAHGPACLSPRQVESAALPGLAACLPLPAPSQPPDRGLQNHRA